MDSIENQGTTKSGDRFAQNLGKLDIPTRLASIFPWHLGSSGAKPKSGDRSLFVREARETQGEQGPVGHDRCFMTQVQKM